MLVHHMKIDTILSVCLFISDSNPSQLITGWEDLVQHTNKKQEKVDFTMVINNTFKMHFVISDNGMK